MAPLQCCIRKSSLMYSMDHNGAFPSNIHDLASYAGNVKLFICPGSGTKPPPSIAECTDWVDYIYISWPTGEKTPADYPWIYDRRLSHHQGRGINLAPIGGPAFWDEGARWLRKFAKEHPDLKIPMPEDLR